MDDILFRADQVGSLLRPPELLDPTLVRARAQRDAELHRVEDRAVLESLHQQNKIGLSVFTDGEFRRSGFVTGFIDAVDGFIPGSINAMSWRGGTGDEPASPNTRLVGETLRVRDRIAQVEVDFLRQHAPGPFKITLPSPAMFALTSWQQGVSDSAYSSREEVVADAGMILAEEIRLLALEGLPYLQIDSPHYTHWGDPTLLEAMRADGVNVDTILTASITADNKALAAAGAITTGVHLCRGNSMGRWLSSGGYEPIAERLFGELRCNRLLLEYDSERAGGFEPLRFLPEDKVAVLGLISTKTAQLESRDTLLARIEEATRYVPIERLALSPQCGFASSGRGNPLNVDDQWRKLELVVSVAAEVWP